MKRTHDLKESVAYLTVMTRHLQKIYSVSFSCMFPLVPIFGNKAYFCLNQMAQIDFAVLLRENLHKFAHWWGSVTYPKVNMFRNCNNCVL